MLLRVRKTLACYLTQDCGSIIRLILLSNHVVKTFLSLRKFEIVIHAFITTRLDYCNSLYYGVNSSSIGRLQLVQNAAARLLNGSKKN